MQIKAVQKNVRHSPRKLREVVPLLKEMSPLEAYEKLPFVKKRAADPIRKTLGTALANAREQGLNDTDLEFNEVQINEGPMLKRWRAGARGMAKPYSRRWSHIRIILGVKDDTKIKKKKQVKGKKIETTKVKSKEEVKEVAEQKTAKDSIVKKDTTKQAHGVSKAETKGKEIKQKRLPSQ